MRRPKKPDAVDLTTDLPRPPCGQLIVEGRISWLDGAMSFGREFRNSVGARAVWRYRSPWLAKFR